MKPCKFMSAVAALALTACVNTGSGTQADGSSTLSYEIVKSLTTEVGARLAGTAKEAEARKWAVAKLRTLGFSNVKEETFEFHAWRRGVGSAELVSPSQQPLVMVALGGSVSTPAQGILAPVVFFESHDDLLKSPPGSLKGKIAFVNDRMTRARDGSGYRTAVRKRSQGAIEASKRGALAVVIRSVGTGEHRFAHTGNMRYEAGVKKIPGVALSGPDADQIERLHRMGKAVRLKLKLQTRDVPRSVSGNVVADIVGSERPDEIILLGAHLDSWDLGTGASDDGAGVAIVVAAALRAAGPTLKPKRTIRVVLYGAEEYTGGGKSAATGGEVYAKAHAAELSKHVLAMEADFGADAPWRFDTNVPASDQDFYEEVFATLRPLGIERGKRETSGGADIQPLHKAGVRIVSIGQDGTRYFDLHHTANDTLDKIDPAALELNVEAYARVVAKVAAR